MNRGDTVGLTWSLFKLTVRAANWVADRIAKKFFTRVSQEAKGTAFGVVVGVAIGFMIGGIGVAALGGAFGIPAAVIFAFIGGMLGNRWGIGRDMKTTGKPKINS
ncbi:hypothetical protein GAY31_18860 [Azospirillum brasilense]|nr:hypothetical protein [Azospirillum brasilense]